MSDENVEMCFCGHDREEHDSGDPAYAPCLTNGCSCEDFERDFSFNPEAAG